MEHSFCYRFPAPVGPLLIAEDGAGISRIDPVSTCPEGPPLTGETPLLREAARQLEEYFSGKRKDFTVPLSPKGTPFQLRVWEALRAIPYGQTISYRELALRAGSPRGFRAVGQANSRNPIPFILPCHRVIAAGGSLGGYSLGLELKKWLLELEGIRCSF